MPGGYLAGLGPLIGEIAGVSPAAITFEKSDGSLHAEVADDLSMSSDQVAGMDGQGPRVISNVPFVAYWSVDFLWHEQLRHRLPVRGLTRTGDG